jgi:hypothetical protein
MIDKVIEEVDKIYTKINENLIKEGFEPIGKPLIKKIALIEKQVIELKELAEKQLVLKLEEKIDKMAMLISEIEDIVEDEKKKKVLYNLRSEDRELKELEKIAKELGIEASNQFALLSSLINQAISELEGI